MSTTNQPEVLSEIRLLLNSGNAIDSQTSSRLALSMLADLYEQLALMNTKIDTHTHPGLDAKIETLGRRDWWGLTGAALIAILTALAAWINAHK